MGTPSSAWIIQDVDIALKVLEIFYYVNGSSVEGIADRNGPKRKLVGEVGSFSWGGARTKGKGAQVRNYQKYFLSQ